MSDFETDNPEFYPIFLILDRSQLPPELSGELLSSVMSGGVNMEGDQILITRDQIEDGNGRDRRKRVGDTKPKSGAGKSDAKKKMSSPGGARHMDNADYDEVITINDDMLDRMRDLVPRLLEEKVAELSERRKLSGRTPEQLADEKKKKKSGGSSKGSRPTSRSTRTAAATAELTSVIGSLSIADDSNLGVLSSSNNAKEDGSIRVPIFFILEGVVKKAGDAQRLASAGFLLSLILVPRLLSASSEPIYYLPELGVVDASQLVNSPRLNGVHSTDLQLEGASEGQFVEGASVATPGVAMASLTIGAAAAAIYRLPSAETVGIDNEHFPKLPGELAVLVSVDLRFTHLACKFIGVPECESVVTVRSKNNPDLGIQRQSRKDRRNNVSAGASLTRPQTDSDDSSRTLVAQSDALVIAGGEVRLALRSFGYDRYAYDAWLFGVRSQDMPVRSNENELAYSDQLYQLLLSNIPHEMMGIETIVYALCQQAGNTATKMTGHLLNNSVPPPPAMQPATQPPNHKDTGMKGVILGMNPNISLTKSTHSESRTFDFALPSGPSVVSCEVDTVQVLENCLAADNLLDFMNRKLRNLVHGAGPSLTTLEDNLVNTRCDTVEYENHVSDMIVTHADDSFSTQVASYCSRSGTTLQQLLSDPEGVLESYGAVLRALEFNVTPVPGAHGAGLPSFAGGGSPSMEQGYGELGVVERSIALAALHNIRAQQTAGNEQKYHRSAPSAASANLQELSDDQVLRCLSQVEPSVVERALVSLAFEHMLSYPGLSFDITSANPMHCGVVGNLPVTYYKGVIRNDENNAYTFQSALNYHSLLFAHLHAISTSTAQVCSIAPLGNSVSEGEDASFNDLDPSYISSGNYTHLKNVYLRQQEQTVVPQVTNNTIADTILHNLQLTSECIPQVVQLLSDPGVQAKIEALLVATVRKQGVFGSHVSEDSVELNVNHGAPTRDTSIQVDGSVASGFGVLGMQMESLFSPGGSPVETLTDRDSWLHLNNQTYNRNLMIPYTSNAFLRLMQNIHCDPVSAFMHTETSYLPVLDALLVSVSSKPNLMREKYQRWSTSFCPNLNFSEWSAAPAFVRKHKPSETFRFAVPHTGEVEARSKLLHPFIGAQSIIGKDLYASGRSKWRQVWAVQDEDWIYMEDHHQNTHTEADLSNMLEEGEVKGLAGYSNSAATRAVILAGKDSRVVKIVRCFSAKLDNLRVYATYEDDSQKRTPAARVCRSDVAAPLLDSNKYRAGVKGLKVSVRDQLGSVYITGNTAGLPFIMAGAEAHSTVPLIREVAQAQSNGTHVLDVDYAIEQPPSRYDPAVSVFVDFIETARAVYNSGTIVLSGHYPCQGHESLRVACDVTLYSDGSILHPVLIKTAVLLELQQAEISEDQEDTMELRHVYIDTKGLCWLKLDAENVPLQESLQSFLHPVSALLTLNNHVETAHVGVLGQADSQAHVKTALSADSVKQSLTLTRADGTQLCVFPNNNTVVQFVDGTRVFLDRCNTEQVQFNDVLGSSTVFVATVDVEHPVFTPVHVELKSQSKSDLDAVLGGALGIVSVAVSKTLLLSDGSLLTRHANSGVTLRKRHGALFSFAPTYTSHYEADLLFGNPNNRGLYNPIPPADDDQGLDVYQTHPVFAVNSEKLGYAKVALRDPRMLLPRCVAIIPAHVLHLCDQTYREYGVGGDISLLLRKLAATTVPQTNTYKVNSLKDSQWLHPEGQIPTGLRVSETVQTEYSKLLPLLYNAKLPLSFQSCPSHAYFMDMRSGTLQARDARDDTYTADLTDPGAVRQVHPIVLTAKHNANMLDISNLHGHAGWNTAPEQSVCQCDPAAAAIAVPGKKAPLKSKEPKKLNLVGICPLCNLPYQPLPRISKPTATHEELLLTADGSAVESSAFGANANLHELRHSFLTTGKKDAMSLAPLLAREPAMDTHSRLFVLFRHLQNLGDAPGTCSTITTHLSKPLTTSTPLQLPSPFTHGFSHAIELCGSHQAHVLKLLRTTLCGEKTTVLPVEIVEQHEKMRLYRMLTCLTHRSPYLQKLPASMTPANVPSKQHVQATAVHELWETRPITKEQVLCSWKAYLKATQTNTEQLVTSTTEQSTPVFKSDEALQSELLWIVMQAKAAQREVAYTAGQPKQPNVSLLEQTVSNSRLLQPNNSRVPLELDSNRLVLVEESKQQDQSSYFESSRGSNEQAVHDLFARHKETVFVASQVAALVLPLLDAPLTVKARSVDLSSPAWKEIAVKCRAIDAVASLLEILGFQQDSETIWVQSVADDRVISYVRIYSTLSEQYITALRQHPTTALPNNYGDLEANRKKFHDKKTMKMKSEIMTASKQFHSGVRTEFGETDITKKTALPEERRAEEERIKQRTHGKPTVHEKWGKSFVDRSIVQDTPREDRAVALRGAVPVQSLTAREMQKLSQLTQHSAVSTVPSYTVRKVEVVDSSAKQFSQTARTSTNSLNVTKPAGELLVLPSINRK